MADITAKLAEAMLLLNYGPLYEYATGRGLDYNELCRVVRAALAATKAEAKPLTDQRIWDAVDHGAIGSIGMPSKAIAVARVIEAACAEAWGVKLTGIGASSGGGNG